MKIIGERLRFLRESVKLSQAKIAKMIGTTQASKMCIRDRCRGHHTDFHCVGKNIREHGVELFCHTACRCVEHVENPAGILRGQRADNAHAINIVGTERF